MNLFRINVSQTLKNITMISGIEISDVLKIDDKDYSITFSLYFNVQWSEPRLNLSTEFFDTENVTGEEQLVPGRMLRFPTEPLLCFRLERDRLMAELKRLIVIHQ